MNKTFGGNESQDKEKLETLERIDGKYIFSEISRVLNFDKGIFYTIKELLIRPGDTVRKYLMYDRKKLVKPIIFVIFTSLLFGIAQRLLEFNIGSLPENIELSSSLGKVLEWSTKNFGITNILMGFLIGFWIKLFFFKSKYNIYEILILVFFTIGIINLIFTFLGIIENITGFKGWLMYSLSYFVTMIYAIWAIGNFFDRKKKMSYFKGFLSYLLGVTTSSLITILVGVLIDILNKSS